MDLNILMLWALFQVLPSLEKEVIFMTIGTLYYTSGILHYSHLHLD
jgi:hypothetical protein